MSYCDRSQGRETHLDVVEQFWSCFAVSGLAPFWQGQDGAEALELIAMQGAQARQRAVACWCQLDLDRSTVVRMRGSSYESLCLGSVHQFDDTVMAQLESIGEFAQGGPLATGIALQGQQKLVLLRSQPVFADGLLAEAQVAPDAEAEPRQRLEVRLRQWICHLLIIHLTWMNFALGAPAGRVNADPHIPE